MSSDTPKFDPTLQNATIDNPACVIAGDTCPAFYNAHQLSQAQVSFYVQFDYGHYISWYLFAALGIFTIAYAYMKWSESRKVAHHPPPPSRTGSVAASKARAMVRYISYRRLPGALSDRLGVPTAGVTILILLFTIYCLALSSAVRPYYRQHRGYGSPPLAIRTGLMAIALTPWIVALSGKSNIITMLTGIGHEKLNVLHRWIGRICLGLSVIHTIPFLVAPVRDGGYAALHKQFYEPGGYEYTGTPALAILFCIVLLSIPYIRHRLYEAFYFSHFLLGVSYVGLMFWHSDNQEDSWIYLWATIAIWLLSTLIRTFWLNRSLNVLQPNWLQGSEAKVSLLPGNVSRIEVLLREEIKTSPGQHCFLRFPALSAFDNHPFTIAWASGEADVREKVDAPPTLTFFIRSRRGFTARLLASTETQPQERTSVWIDGPYGGIDSKLERSFDQMLLVAGGIGITGCLPWLQHVAKCHGDEEYAIRLSSVKLVWVVHQASHIAWADACLQSLARCGAARFLTIDIYCTSLARPLGSTGASASESSDVEKADQTVDAITAADDAVHDWKPIPGRPDVGSIIGGLRGGKAVVIGESNLRMDF